MTRWTTGLTLFSLFALVMGCGAAGPKVPPSVDVGGTVQIDGAPLPEGEISLMVTGQSPSLIPIKDGKFSGKAMVGESHVQIFAHRMGKPIMMGDKPFGDPVKENYADEKFNVKSEIKTTVAAGGTKDMKFDIQAKK